MGVDYYQCNGCTAGFRDDSERCAWCDCGNCFCSVECGKLQNYGEWDSELESWIRDEGIDTPSTCCICRNESYTDYTLLEAVLKHFKITRKQAINIWRMGSK